MVVEAIGTRDGSRGPTDLGAYSRRRFQPLEPGRDRIRAAYGANYKRLAEVKAKWDPGTLFRVNKNIAPLAS